MKKIYALIIIVANLLMAIDLHGKPLNQQHKAAKEQQQPALPNRSPARDIRKREEFQAGLERAKRKAPSWLERARDFFGFGNKETPSP